MTNRTALTDEGIESERKNGAHKRGQWIDNAVTVVIISLIASAGILCVGGIFYGGFTFAMYIKNPDSVSQKSIDILSSISTHALAVVGGYAAHIFRRVMGASG